MHAALLHPSQLKSSASPASRHIELTVSYGVHRHAGTEEPLSHPEVPLVRSDQQRGAAVLLCDLRRRAGAMEPLQRLEALLPVSYTHLTLPTICSV